MMDFQIKRSGRRCHATDRELTPGEEFISELVAADSGAPTDFERRDYCLEAWQGPVDGSIGWWRSRIPEPDSGKVYWAPADVLREYFARLQQSTDNRAEAFVMAMLLVRKRLMRMEAEEIDEQDQPWLVVRDSASRQEHRVAVVELSPAERAGIQQEFAEQLFTDQPPG